MVGLFHNVTSTPLAVACINAYYHIKWGLQARCGVDSWVPRRCKWIVQDFWALALTLKKAEKNTFHTKETKQTKKIRKGVLMHGLGLTLRLLCYLLFKSAFCSRRANFCNWGRCHSFLCPAGQTHLNCCPKLLQVVEYHHGYTSRPALAEGLSSKVIGRGMIGKGMTDMTLVLFPCQTFPCPFFSLVSGRSQILHFAVVRVKLDASALFMPGPCH